MELLRRGTKSPMKRATLMACSITCYGLKQADLHCAGSPERRKFLEWDKQQPYLVERHPFAVSCNRPTTLLRIIYTFISSSARLNLQFLAHPARLHWFVAMHAVRAA